MSDTNQSRNPDSPVSTSINLLNLVISGNEQAWRRLVELYSALIYSKCRSSGLSEHDASDVVQDVFISIHRSLPNFRRGGVDQGFRRWLRTVARNAITDHFRQLQKQPGQAGGGTDVLRNIQNLADPFADETSLSLADHGVTLMLRRALESIRADYEERTWQAFWRTAVEGQRPVDVAADMDLKPGTVRQAKSKILTRLRAELDDLL